MRQEEEGQTFRIDLGGGSAPAGDASQSDVDRLFRALARAGFELPYFLTVIGANGSLLHFALTGEELFVPILLVSFGEALHYPLNAIACDGSGRARRFVIEFCGEAVGPVDQSSN